VECDDSMKPSYARWDGVGKHSEHLAGQIPIQAHGLPLPVAGAHSPRSFTLASRCNCTSSFDQRAFGKCR